MSRSPLVSLSSCALVALLLAPASANAQGFTEADLVGGYAFQAGTEAGNGNTVGFGFGGLTMTTTGKFTLDGAGIVTDGVRTTLRPLFLTGSLEARTEVVEQTFTGSYSVEPDGTGVMTIEPTPTPPWDVVDNDDAHLTFPPTETIRFTLAEGGRRLLFSQDVRAIRRPVSNPALFPRDAHLFLVGQAESQAPADDLTDLVARQSAQLCEVLRLLNTPQGQRETSTPEVVEACGTGYEWNGEGTDGPRRGR